MTEQRDLTADLAICAAATAGPWVQKRGAVWAGQRKVLSREPSARGYGDGGYETHVASMVANATFAALARTGWPEAIRRAMSAEALMARTIAMMTDKLTAAERRTTFAQESLQSVLRCLTWEAEDWEAYKRYRANEVT